MKLKIFFILNLSFFYSAQADLLQCRLGNLKPARDQVNRELDRMINDLKKIQQDHISQVQKINQKAMAFSKTDPLGTNKIKELQSKSLSSYDKFANESVLGKTFGIQDLPFVKALQGASDELKNKIKEESERMVADINTHMDAVNKKINDKIKDLQDEAGKLKSDMNKSRLKDDYITENIQKGFTSINKKKPEDGSPVVGIKISAPKIDLCDFENIDDVMASKYKELEKQVKALPEQMIALMKQTMVTVIMNAAMQSGIIQEAMELQTKIICIPKALEGIATPSGLEAFSKSKATCLNKDVVEKKREEKDSVSTQALTLILPGGFVNIPFLGALGGAQEKEDNKMSKKAESISVIAGCLTSAFGDAYKRAYDLCVSGKGSSDTVTFSLFKDLKFGFNSEFKKIKQQKCVLDEAGEKTGADMFPTAELVKSVFDKDNLPPVWVELGAQSYQDNYNSLVVKIATMDKSYGALQIDMNKQAQTNLVLSLPTNIYSKQRLTLQVSDPSKSAAETAVAVMPVIKKTDVTLDMTPLTINPEHNEAGKPIVAGANGSDTTEKLILESKLTDAITHYKNAVTIYNSSTDTGGMAQALQTLSLASIELDIVLKAKIAELYLHSYYFPRIDQVKENTIPLILLPAYKKTHIDPYNQRDPDLYLNKLKNIISHERNLK